MHTHNHTYYNKAFIWGILLNSGYIIIEYIFGFILNSTALLADASHNLGDVVSLIFAFTAYKLSLKKPFGNFTFGLKKITVLISIVNAILLFGAIVIIGFEALQRLSSTVEINGEGVALVAVAGIIVNGITALLFLKGKDSDLNLRGAFLHMLSDTLISLGVVIAGVIIYFTGLYIIDPAVTFIILAVILIGIWDLFSKSFKMAIDAVPHNINLAKVKEYFSSVKGVRSFHDLHIWAMSTTESSLTVHIVSDKAVDDNTLLKNISNDLNNLFRINHSTIQIEHPGLDDSKCEQGC
ncbi:MAG: cation transporter [Ignavibacteria bacterium]|nr:cation transporter [Ignavibacteria bacterium]